MCSFFFNDTATTEIYTLSLHDALPICGQLGLRRMPCFGMSASGDDDQRFAAEVHERRRLADRRRSRPELVDVALDCADRKSTRLNSSHANISYAVFCLKKKKQRQNCLS